MRYTTACLFAAGLALLFAPAVDAQTTETTFEDPAGDAGPAQVGLGPATSELDIVEVTLASDEEAQTTVQMELSSFDVRPPDTIYGVAFETNDTFVWAAYGKIVVPFPPFQHEGFYGCQVTDHDQHCMELDGEEIDDENGFAVELPTAWTPAGQTVHEPMGAVFTDTFVPAASDGTWEHVWPANAHDLATADTDHEVPGEDEPAADEPVQASTSSTDETDGSVSLASIGGASAAGLSLIGLAGAVHRLR